MIFFYPTLFLSFCIILFFLSSPERESHKCDLSGFFFIENLSGFYFRQEPSINFCNRCNTVCFDSPMFPLLYFREKMPPRPQGRRPEPENNGVSLSTVMLILQYNRKVICIIFA